MVLAGGLGSNPNLWDDIQMKQISIDVSKCQTVDDVYTILLSALAAPNWHGHNLDALWDSITSDINDVMPPYSIEVSGKNEVSDALALLIVQMQSIFEEARANQAIEVSFKLT